jgi:galactonate dehydratase
LGSLEADARQAVEAGFDAYKHGFGKPSMPFDVERQVDMVLSEFKRIRAALGPDVDLMLDAAGMFTSQAAHRLIEGLLPLKMFFIEEPVNQDTVTPTLRIKEAFPNVRIALGERLCTRWAFREFFQRQAIDVCQTDISHTGGISELMRIAHYAEVYGVPIAPHNPYGAVALAASAHAAAAMHNFLILEHCRLYPWFNDVQRVAVPITKGHVDMIELSRRPGLGVELNLELVRSRPFAPLDLLTYTQSDGSNLTHQ